MTRLLAVLAAILIIGNIIVLTITKNSLKASSCFQEVNSATIISSNVMPNQDISASVLPAGSNQVANVEFSSTTPSQVKSLIKSGNHLKLCYVIE